jgi:hypothetical protein
MSEVQRLEAVAARLEAVATKLESGGFAVGTSGGGAPAAAPAGGVPASVAAYAAIMSGPMAEFLALSNKIGGVTSEAAGKVEAAFNVVGETVAMASVCKKPVSSPSAYMFNHSDKWQGDLGAVFADLNAAIKAVTGIRKPKVRLVLSNKSNEVHVCPTRTARILPTSSLMQSMGVLVLSASWAPLKNLGRWWHQASICSDSSGTKF